MKCIKCGNEMILEREVGRYPVWLCDYCES
jgi:hypothetical protein